MYSRARDQGFKINHFIFLLASAIQPEQFQVIVIISVLIIVFIIFCVSTKLWDYYITLHWITLDKVFLKILKCLGLENIKK